MMKISRPKITSIFLRLIFTLSIFSLTSCTKNEEPIGSAGNPLKFYFVPSVDAKLLESTGLKVKEYLEKVTPYKYKFVVPSSFVAVVESFGTKRADITAINTFGYIMAHERYGAQAKITYIRSGSDVYRAQVIARADSKINKLEDINGKKFAYVDPSSTSGYLLPAKIFADRSIKPAETVFAQKHDNVVTMVYQGQVDAGATFYSPPRDGHMEDARRLVLTQFPDVEKKIKIVELTDTIPNDPIVFRKELPPELVNTVVDALLEYVKTEEGKKVFHDIYGVTGMVKSDDSRYDSVREILKKLGKTAAELSKK